MHGIANKFDNLFKKIHCHDCNVKHHIVMSCHFFVSSFFFK